MIYPLCIYFISESVPKMKKESESGGEFAFIVGSNRLFSGSYYNPHNHPTTTLVYIHPTTTPPSKKI
jgi:hypothetical protein